MSARSRPRSPRSCACRCGSWQSAEGATIGSGSISKTPPQLFIPARLLLGLIFSLATMFIAILTGRTGFQSIGMLLLFVAIFILVFEHVLPLLIVRRNPERVLEVLLPPFDVAAPDSFTR